MLISKNMAEQMNAQVGNEFGASLQYVNVAGYFDDAGLPVLAQFFLRQADEERMNAMKIRALHHGRGWPPRHSPA